jgi:hypothetical protein
LLGTDKNESTFTRRMTKYKRVLRLHRYHDE